MAAGNKKLVQGVELLEFAIPNEDGSLVGVDWKRFENVAPGTVSYTGNADTETSIIPEDKDVPIIILSTPGDPDEFNFGLLEISEDNFNVLFNVQYDEATSKVTVLANRKRANLAIRLTTRPVHGRKKVITYPNTSCTTTFVNNFTKDALVEFGVVAAILSFTTEDGKDGIYTIQTVLEDGSTIDGTPPTASAGADTTSTAATKALTGTASAASPKTVSSIKWTPVSGPNVPGITGSTTLTPTLTGLINGTYVVQMTVTDSAGVSSTDKVTVVVTISG